VSLSPVPVVPVLEPRGVADVSRSSARSRVDLEKRFRLWLLALVAATCAIYAALAPSRFGLGESIVLMGALGMVAATVAHHVLFKPIRVLVLRAEAVGAGDFTRRLRVDRRDEIGSLALAMDTMCDQLEAAKLAADDHIAALDQLRHSDRVATIGRLVSSVAHELGNPLNVIELRAQLIYSGDCATLEQARQNAGVIVEQTRRMTAIIGEILSFARIRPTSISRLDLASVLCKAITLSQHISRKHKTQIVFHAPATRIEIDGDADKLLQVAVNLIVNGLQAMPHGGAVNIRLGDEHCAPIDDPAGEHRHYVRVEVSDGGVGIAADNLAKVFEPFFSTKIADGGTGLGLSVAQGIAREHEGWLSVESELGHGSTFVVHLPKAGAQGGSQT
jgi:two-component system NtrC family sensor kinase